MKPALCFDAETTGIDVFNDRIVQFVISLVDASGSVDTTWEWIIDPGIPIPEGASEVHGFTTEYVQENGLPAVIALTEIKQVFVDHRNIPWIAFNLNYDLSILDEEFKRHGITDTFGSWAAGHATLIDPLVIDRAKDKYRKGPRKLEFIAAHYGVDFDAEAAHKADYDVEITAKVAAKVIERYGVPTTKEQAAWHNEWAIHLQEYFRKKDPEAVVDSAWPLREKEEK